MQAIPLHLSVRPYVSDFSDDSEHVKRNLQLRGYTAIAMLLLISS